MASFSKRGKYWRAQVWPNGQEGKSRTPRTFDAKAEAQVWARSAVASVPGAAALVVKGQPVSHFKRVDLFLRIYPEQVLRSARDSSVSGL